MGVVVYPPKRKDIVTGLLAGTSSYPNGTGYSIDLSSVFSSIDTWDYVFEVVSTFNAHRLEHTISGTTVTVKIYKENYDAVASIGNASGQPSGVTIQVASGQATASESAHTHATNHDHASFASAAANGGTSGVTTVGGVDAMTSHTHTIDILSLTGTSGAPSVAHSHVRNYEYAHDHAIVTNPTDCTIQEVPNATNVSALRWRWMAWGTLA